MQNRTAIAVCVVCLCAVFLLVFMGSGMAAQTEILVNRVLRLTYEPHPDDLWSGYTCCVLEIGETKNTRIVAPQPGYRFIVKGLYYSHSHPSEAWTTIGIMAGSDPSKLRRLFWAEIPRIYGTNVNDKRRYVDQIDFGDGLVAEANEGIYLACANHPGSYYCTLWGYRVPVAASK